MIQGPSAFLRAGLATLAAHQYDLLVVGGGITGAGVLRDAAMRGLRAALVDRADFGAGTSSRSSRLIHGGLRYLEHFQWGLVFEALQERRILLRIAPHLVRRLAFVVPVHHGDRVPRWKLAAGLALYGALAAGGNVPRPRMLGKARLLALEPNLRAKGLRGGGLYYDAQCDDARLVIATLRSALVLGAVAASYVELTGLETRDGMTLARLRDRLTGTEATITARAVVNATGPWSDAVRRLEDPSAPPLLRPTRGAHVVVRRSRLGHTHGITFTSPVDGRVMFVLPWGEFSYVGTTETDAAPDTAPDQADPDEIQYLLRSANSIFPHARLSREDVVATWAGLRPLLAGDPATPASAVSREHRVLLGPKGMLTVAGGKLTTYRRMAEEVVDRVVRMMEPASGPARYPRAPTDAEPLVGGETAAVEPLRQAGIELGLSAATLDRLVRLYGTETAALLNLVRGNRALASRIHPDHPGLAAEVVHAARRELAQRVEDVLDRRMHLTTETADQGLAAARPVAEWLGREMGWEEERIREEAERFSPSGPPAAAA